MNLCLRGAHATPKQVHEGTGGVPSEASSWELGILRVYGANDNINGVWKERKKTRFPSDWQPFRLH